MNKFIGTGTANVTPFKGERVDYNALRQLIEFQIHGGIDFLVPCGTTGESPTLSPKQHDRVIDFTIEIVAGRIPVLAGTGSNSTSEAIRMTKHALMSGASGSLQITPYYNKPPQEGLFRHFMKIADVGLPLVLYNVPGRTGVNLETKTVERLSNHPNIVAIKEASGNMSQIEDILRYIPIDVISGDDKLTLPIIFMGGKGAISVVSNAFPDETSAMVRAALNFDYRTALSMHNKLYPLFVNAFIETNPGPIKAVLAHMGMIKEEYRLPMCELTQKNREKLIETYEKVKSV